ncbi:thioredoxin [Lachnospiraceae bacterium C7]|nr:thioredoxin [Lachnospiraceae bacterium C7]
MSEVTITKDNFEKEVLKSDIPVLVDFWASWCGPCKMLAPTVAQIAEEYAGKVKVGKINVDDEQELAMKYGIASIPTLLVFKNGQVTKSSVGVVPKERIEDLLA